MTTQDSQVLLTVRGTLAPKTLEAACKLHNETAGSPQGVAAARALGDLSHKVYTPVEGAPGAEPGEVLFLDVWARADGLAKFFGDPRVHEQAGKLFTKREGVVWMPARGAYGFDLPAPASKKERYLGVVRGVVKGPEQAIEAFRAAMAPKLADARRRGQLSHAIYMRLPNPGESLPPELFGIDVWCDAEGMQEHYKALTGLEKAFAGPPQTSVFEEARGGVWSEW